MLALANLLFIFSFSVKGDLSQCESDLKGWVSSFVSETETNYTKMVEYSGRFINELGLYFPCQDLSNAEYVIFEFYEVPAVVIGLCLPNTCTIDDYWALLGEPSSDFTSLFTTLTGPAKSLQFATTPKVSALASRKLADSLVTRIVYPKDHVYGIKNFSGSAAAMLAIMILLLMLAVIGTIVEFTVISVKNTSMQSSESSGENTSINSSDLDKSGRLSGKGPKHSKFVQILLCFSLYSNAVRLFAVKDEKKKDPLDCLNAVRVLSIGWVVMGHTNLFRAENSVIINPDDIQNYFKHANYSLVESATYAVDSFFWLSGFLQGYLMTMQLANSKKVNWVMIGVHRFIRILPLYMFILLAGWTLTPYIGNGPKWYNANSIMHTDCDRYFWTYPLFLNNFVLPQTTNNCLVGAWYLPNDMQFFLLSIPIMYLYVRHSRIFGWGILSMCIVFSIIAGGTITYDEHLTVKTDSANDTHLYMNDLYYKPYVRITPYCIGLLGGFVYHAYKKKKAGQEFDPLAAWIADVYNNSRIVRFVSYAFGLFLINLFIFLQITAFQGDNRWSRSQNAAYIAFQRLGWGLGMNSFFLPMMMGHMSFFRPFFQSNWWAPVAKLVFGVYLIHMVVGQTYFFSQPVSYYWGQESLFIDTVFVLFTSFMFIIPITLIVEMPMIGVEKILLGR